MRKYLVELEQQNPMEEPVHQQDQVSTTDPDSTYATKGGTPARLGYYDNYLMDNDSCVIVGVQATAARLSQETWPRRHAHSLRTVAGTRTLVGGRRRYVREWGVSAMVARSWHHALYANPRQCAEKEQSVLRSERFTYLPESNSYRCPAGEQLNYVGLNVRNRAHAYIGSAKRCGACCQKPQCTSGRYKYLAIHMHEPARQRPRDLANTPAFARHNGAEESRGDVCGTQESYRAASLALTTDEVRSGAVLPCSGGAEHQTTGALPQPTDNTHWGSHHLTEVSEESGATPNRMRFA